MAVPVHIQPMLDLPDGFHRLRRSADAEGFAFLARLRMEWRAGHNRFDGPGECLLGAFSGPECVAVGGLNRDPYAGDPKIGRLRHLYVLPGWRGSGVGRAMAAALISRARGVYRTVRLRTDTDEASAFYLRCGFKPAPNGEATHVLDI